MKTVIVTPQAPQAIGAYVQAVAQHDLLFCSGQIALCPDGTMTVGSVADEARQVLQNLEAILLAGGATFATVLQTTIYLVDMADFSTVNEVYASYFTPGMMYPSRSTVAVSALPRGARVEISMIAHRLMPS